MNNKIFSTFLVTALALGMTSMAAAQASGETEVDGTVVSTTGPFNGSVADQQETLSAGEIKNVTLDGARSTYSWAGLHGEASGEIILGDANDNDRLYDWTASVPHVIASDDASLDFSSLSAGTVSEMTTQYSHLSGNQADNASETFNGTTDLTSTLFSVTDAVAATTYDNGDTQTWETAYVNDGAGSDAFVGVTKDDGTSFWGGTTPSAGQDAYQMILPEAGDGSGSTTTSYNLWLELE